MLFSIFIQAEAKIKNPGGEENFRLTASNKWDNDDGMIMMPVQAGNPYTLVSFETTPHSQTVY